MANANIFRAGPANLFSDYYSNLTREVQPSELQERIGGYLKDRGITNTTIGVISGKGRSGKSQISLNLAHAIGSFHIPTGVFDLDIATPSLFGYARGDFEGNPNILLPSAIIGNIDLADVGVESKHNSNVVYFPSGYESDFLDKKNEITETASKNLIEKIKKLDNISFGILDLPAGSLDSDMINLYRKCDAGIVVINCEGNGRIDNYQSLDALLNRIHQVEHKKACQVLVGNKIDEEIPGEAKIFNLKSPLHGSGKFYKTARENLQMFINDHQRRLYPYPILLYKESPVSKFGDDGVPIYTVIDVRGKTTIFALNMRNLAYGLIESARISREKKGGGKGVK